MNNFDTSLEGEFLTAPVVDPEPIRGSDGRASYAQRVINNPEFYDASRNDGTVNRNPEGIAFWKLVAEDYRTHGAGAFSQGFWALFWHRFGNWRMSVWPKPLRAPFSVLYRVGAKFTQWFAGIDLPYTVNVGRRVRIEHFGGMILIAHAIGNDVVIRQNTTFGIARTEQVAQWPVIGDGADIGVGVAILGRVNVGRDAIIGANAVVLKDIPEGAVAVGVPARIIDKA